VAEPTEGDSAPDFELPADDGRRIRLSDFRGRRVVLYFYPKDDTPGCTTQACDFRDALRGLSEEGAVVLGVSPDPVRSHAEFRAKLDLNFPLLADEDHSVAEGYGVWKEKMMYGNRYWGVERSTFLIDASGRVAKVWRRVIPEGHAEEVVAAVRGVTP
jgi:peroxiredoxin Q/BCP